MGCRVKTLQAVLFRDGRPGHEKQSQGILQALNHYIDLHLHEVVVDEKTRLNWVFDYLFFFLGYFNRSRNLLFKPDLLIGSGSRTHIPLLSCKKKHGGYAITCMTPSGSLLRYFDLCFVPIHDRVQNKSNIVETIGPPNIAKNRNGHDGGKSMILVGGADERSHHWDSKKIFGSIVELLRFSKDQQWTISTSPRTPGDIDELLALLADEYTNVWYIPYRETRPGWIENQYDLHRNVWVTGDSISMVYEALSAGCRVGIVPVQWKRDTNKFLYSTDYLIENKRVITLNQYLQGMPYHHLSQPLNEADRCAKEILRRWWPENLP